MMNLSLAIGGLVDLQKITKSKTMTKDIKDYLHLYLGSEFLSDYPTNPTSPQILTGHTFEQIVHCTNDGLCWNPKYIKLLLRPLSDMTEEERTTVIDINVQMLKQNSLTGSMKYDGHSCAYLLSKGFDLFGLIEAGLAIDKTKQ